MKRGGPLTRRTPLKARARLKTRKPLRAKAKAQISRTATPRSVPTPRPRRTKSARLAAYDAEFERAKPLVRSRSRGYCEASVSGVCAGTAAHVHHRKLRSQGGSNAVANLLDVCLPCHDWAHAQPVQAVALGLIVPRHEEETPLV